MIFFVYCILQVIIHEINSQNEQDFQYLINMNLMPQNLKKILSAGFPRGFLGHQYGMSVVAKEHLSDDPITWYQKLWSAADQELICDLARENKFNCFLFNVMAREYIYLLRFSRSGPRHLSPNSKSLTVNFIYQYCRMRFLAGLSMEYDTRGYCPNPCFNKTIYCELLANTKDGQCKVDTDFPYREDGFQCICKDKYIWMKHAKMCISMSSSLRPEELGCLRSGTHSVSDSGGTIFRCICKTNYFGKKCENVADACKYSISGKLAGNAACVVNHGNQCISSGPFRETINPFYHCQCTENYRRNYSFPQDNCLNELQPCERVICIHGSCVSTTPRMPAQCFCQNGWHGKNCDIPVPDNSISPWTQWSTCSPVCGESRIRQRIRKCLRLFCNNERDIDVRPCRPRSCYRYHHPDSRDRYIMGVQLSDDERKETDYITYCMIVIVIANLILAAAFIQWRLLRPFLKIVGTHKAEMEKEYEALMLQEK